MDSIYIVMPAYNEQDNIKGVVNQWYPIVDKIGNNSKLVIADSGSSDDTHDILIELKKEYPRIDILNNTDKQHGPKVIALYKYAIENGADYVFQTDSDGQTNPEEFDEFWKERLQYDGIFGHRNDRGDGKSRAFVEKVVCMLLKLYFGVKVPDANAPFRLMKCDVLKKYIYKLDDNYNLPNIMVVTYYVHYKEKVAFKKITFKPRQAGKNSINIRRIIGIGWKALGDFHKLKMEM